MTAPGRRGIVLALGNDILGDDGAGIAAGRQLKARVPDGVDVVEAGFGGFHLLDHLEGYPRALVLDAVATGTHPPGTVLSFPFEALGTEAGPSPHAVGLPTVVSLGRQSGVPLPRRIRIVAIEVEDMETVCEGLTPAVRKAVPRAADAVLGLLGAVPAVAVAVA